MIQKTSVDWFRFRTQAQPMEGLEALRPLFGTMADCLFLEPLGRGCLGFQQGAVIKLADMVVGRCDYGGEMQRGWVRWDLTGKGCEWVSRWDEIDLVEALPRAEIRRLDIALTTWDSEIGHDLVVDAHTASRFCSGGRPPALQQITNSDPRAGRTCNIGKREGADKFFRGYEKGFELVGKLPPSLGDACTHLEGHPVEGIYRCEVELKAENRPIPWECIERRDQYFAGSYPFCADVLPGVEADILMRRPERAAQTELAAALQNLKVQWGQTLFTALAAYGGDMTAVWDKVVGKGHNVALVEAGVLLVDHE